MNAIKTILKKYGLEDEFSDRTAVTLIEDLCEALWQSRAEFADYIYVLQNCTTEDIENNTPTLPAVPVVKDDEGGDRNR